MSETIRGSQTDVVVDGIKRMILEGSIGAGGRLPVEADLAELLGVSRGSLREGVRALSAMGVLESRQGSGTYVTGLEPSTLMAPLSFIVELHGGRDTVDLHTVRRILETAAAQAAARLITPEQLERAEQYLATADALAGTGTAGAEAYIEADLGFHHVIAEASGNAVLSALIDALGDRTQRIRMWRAIVDAEVSRGAVTDHRAILNDLRAGDSERAGVHMAEHLFGIEDFVRSGSLPVA